MGDNSEAELQDYLRHHNIEPLLKEIVVKLCLNKPDNALEFIRDFVASKIDVEEDAPRSVIQNVLHFHLVCLFVFHVERVISQSIYFTTLRSR